MYCKGEWGWLGKHIIAVPVLPWDSGWVDLLLWCRGKPWVLHHSGPHLSLVDLGQVHTCWPCSKVVTPWSQTGVVPDSHSAHLGKPPNLYIIVAATHVIGAGVHKHSCWVSHQSWYQCAPHWIMECGPQHCSFWHRHMANWYLHPPAALAFGPHLPGWVGRLGKGASTWLLGWRITHT